MYSIQRFSRSYTPLRTALGPSPLSGVNCQRSCPIVSESPPVFILIRPPLPGVKCQRCCPTVSEPTPVFYLLESPCTALTDSGCGPTTHSRSVLLGTCQALLVRLQQHNKIVCLSAPAGVKCQRARPDNSRGKVHFWHLVFPFGVVVVALQSKSASTTTPCTRERECSGRV